MNAIEIKKLLEKYFEGQTSLEEEEELRLFFASEDVPDELKSFIPHFQFFAQFEAEGEQLPDDDFLFSAVEAERGGKARTIDFPSQTNGLPWLKYAAGLGLLILGFAAGFLANGDYGRTELADHRNTSTEEHGKILVGLNYNASASERILAISQTSEIDQMDPEVLNVLVRTMNYDDNVNVRLAAIEALSKFTREEAVRDALIKALEVQDNPMVQIALIDMMVKIGEKKAINEMQRLVIDDNTQEVVKQSCPGRNGHFNVAKQYLRS